VQYLWHFASPSQQGLILLAHFILVTSRFYRFPHTAWFPPQHPVAVAGIFYLKIPIASATASCARLVFAFTCKKSKVETSVSSRLWCNNKLLLGSCCEHCLFLILRDHSGHWTDQRRRARLTPKLTFLRFSFLAKKCFQTCPKLSWTWDTVRRCLNLDTVRCASIAVTCNTWSCRLADQSALGRLDPRRAFGNLRRHSGHQEKESQENHRQVKTCCRCGFATIVTSSWDDKNIQPLLK